MAAPPLRPTVRRPMLAFLAGLVVLQTAPAAAAPARLSDPAVRAFMARQEAAWNARDARGYFASFAPRARFVEQGRTNTGGVIRYGSSTLEEARRYATRFFAGPAARDRTTLTAVVVAAGGRSAEVAGQKVTTLADGRRRCAEVRQTLSLAAGRIQSLGETSTAIRCRDAARSP
jgi:hypothetical protein